MSIGAPVNAKSSSIGSRGIMIPEMLFLDQEVAASSAGVRKTDGKSGGLPVIYYNMLADGRVVLLLVYGKNVVENIPGSTLKLVQEKIHASFKG